MRPWIVTLIVTATLSAAGAADWRMSDEQYSCYTSGMTLQELASGGVTVVSHTPATREYCGEAHQWGLKVCPYDAPQFGPEPNPKMQKCDFCLEEWTQGKQPICIRACPTRAMDAGTLEHLRDKYGDGTKADGFKYHPKARPSIIFNQR